MKDRILPVNFVDGSEVNVDIFFGSKKVVLHAYDEKTKQRYELLFIRCIEIAINYTDELDLDLYNLTDGISGETIDDEIKKFVVNFADESTLMIRCHHFEIRVVA